MKILILGGTVFLGRHLAEVALEHGHEVTLFNRGMHASPFGAEVEQLKGDRDGNLSALEGRSFDAVIDTNGYVPRLVRASAQLLAPAVKQYVFISSISAYADFSTIGIDENAPVGTINAEQVAAAEKLKPAPQGIIAQTYGEMYGSLKALCEREVEAAFPERALNLRVGLIVGPYDYSDRLTYWVGRVAKGGEVLAPGRPERGIQLLDVRDLAEWILHMLEQGQAGLYNVTGPETPITMGQLLETSKDVSGSDATFTWLDEQFLLEKGAAPWSEIPLWVPETDEATQGFLAIKIQKALATGLAFRPLGETMRDILDWDAQRSPDGARQSGLAMEKEKQLLAEWHQRK